MTEQQAPQTETPDPLTEERLKLCRMLYIIFAASLVLQFINIWTVAIGSAAITAGIILAYMERRKAYGSLYGNHLQWLIRTFWIGGAVYLPVVTLLGAIALAFLMDFQGPMQEAYATGEGSVPKAIVAMLKQNKTVIYTTMAGFTAPFALWWWWRCWYGYQRLKAGKPILNPMSWF